MGSWHGCHGGQTNFAMESVKDTMTTVDAMKAAHKSLKSEVKKINIDKVEVSGQQTRPGREGWGYPHQTQQDQHR